MTGAKVHLGRDGFYVGYTLRGEECDLAGPFEDEIDAVLAAKRANTDTLDLMVGGFVLSADSYNEHDGEDNR